MPLDPITLCSLCAALPYEVPVIDGVKSVDQFGRSFFIIYCFNVVANPHLNLLIKCVCVQETERYRTSLSLLW